MVFFSSPYLRMSSDHVSCIPYRYLRNVFSPESHHLLRVAAAQNRRLSPLRDSLDLYLTDIPHMPPPTPISYHQPLPSGTVDWILRHGRRLTSPCHLPASCFHVVRGQSSRMCCLLYTSDAADDLLCVDLGGRRI